MWSTLVAEFPSEDHAAVSAAATAAVLASATEAEDGNAPPWRPDNEYTSEVSFDVISSRSALSGPGNDGQRFANLQRIIHTNIGKGGVRPGHDSLLEVIRLRTGRVPAGVVADLPAVECHRCGRRVSTGLRGHGMEEAHHRKGYATEAANRGGQPRGEVVWGHRTRRIGARRTKGTNAT